MSKYTTEVRYICESKSGLNVSDGADSVDEIISKSWDKIFTSRVRFFDEDYRAVLCQKILKHYYMREIGTETFGIWKLWMNTRLEEIMPYYNQLYESAKIEFNPLDDVKLTRELRRTEQETETKNRDVTQNGNSTNNGETSSNSKDLYSDTPQGSISGLESNTYLTNARIIESGDNVNSNAEYTNTESENNENETNTTENYIETLAGKQGGSSFSKSLMEFRDTLLNIDMLVIEEFNDLFMGLW